MPRIYDSSHLTQRRAEKAIAGGFYTKAGTAPNSFTGFQPQLGMKDSSVLYAVKTGQMTEYTRYDQCIAVSAGCPCASLDASLITPPYIPQLPGAVSGITFTVGSIILSWTAPTSGNAPFRYVVTPYLNGVAQTNAAITTTELTYRFTNLQEWQPYTFTVCALNGDGQGPDTQSGTYLSPPQNLGAILSGSTVPVEISSSLNYIINNGLNSLMTYVASFGTAPTVSSRIMYLWVSSVVQAWNWVCKDSRITGTHDTWNWDQKATTPLNDSDAIIWMCLIVDYLTPTFVPTYVSSYSYSADNVTRVKAAGQWDTWQALWSSWYSFRQTDGAAAAITTMPTGSANWDSTIVVDGVTVNNIAGFPNPLQWTRLTVQGKKQKYATYLWDSVLSTCMTGTNEQEIATLILPVTPADREFEIDSLLYISQELNDYQKVQAEFWAGSAIKTVSPPLMAIWLWKEYVRSIGVNPSILMFSLMDLAIHEFEAGRVIWGLKARHMESRPIQEIRRRYAGQQIKLWSGTMVDGAQWIPYQRANFVTPPFPDFVSGHSGFTKSFALTMDKWFGNTIQKNVLTYDHLELMAPMFSGSQMAAYGDFVVPVGTSTVEPGIVPRAPVTLSYNTWDMIAEHAGMSRIYGGIHTISAHYGSQTAAVSVDGFINSTWNVSVSPLQTV